MSKTSTTTMMVDRFSMLLLEPGEVYFTDLAVTYHTDPHGPLDPNASSSLVLSNEVRGRLKICSKSIVFVPQQSADPTVHPDTAPLLKFPLADCKCIKGQSVAAAPDRRQLPPLTDIPRFIRIMIFLSPRPAQPQNGCPGRSSPNWPGRAT